MGHEHAGDPRDLLATLEEKLRHLENELRASAARAPGHDAPPPREWLAAQPPAPEPPPLAPQPPTPHTPPSAPQPPAPEPPPLAAPSPAPEPAAPPLPAQPPAPEPAAPPLAPQPPAPEPAAPPLAAQPPRPEPAAPPPPAAAPPPAPPVDAELLAAARRDADELRGIVEALAGAADELRVLARTVAADHAGALLRLQRAAAAARRAVDAADRPGPELVPEAVLVEAGPIRDHTALEGFLAALAALPDARDVHLRTFDAGRAVLEVRLADAPGA